MPQVIEATVDGGKASAGPPLGPALGPAGVNIGQVIGAINEKTASYNGMKVPVKVIVADDKSFDIEVGTPPASALILKEAGLTSGSDNARKNFVGNLTCQNVVNIIKMKGDDLLGGSNRAKAKEIVGTCVSMGVKFEGLNARAAMDVLDTGKFDDKLEA